MVFYLIVYINLVYDICYQKTSLLRNIEAIYDYFMWTLENFLGKMKVMNATSRLNCKQWTVIYHVSKLPSTIFENCTSFQKWRFAKKHRNVKKSYDSLALHRINSLALWVLNLFKRHAQGYSYIRAMYL